MMAATLLIIAVNIATYLEFLNGEVTQKPDSAAVLTGSSVRFSCSTSDINKARWDYFRLRSTERITVWNGMRMGKINDSRFRVNISQCQRDRQCDLVIDSVRLDDAGFVVCIELGKSVSYAAALLVLDRNLECNMDDRSFDFIEDDSIRLGCSLVYNGSLTPLIMCEPGTPTRDASTPNKITQTVVAVARTNMNNSTIKCEARFASSRSSNQIGLDLNVDGVVLADNIPSFVSHWHSPVLRVATAESTTTILPTTTITVNSITTSVTSATERLNCSTIDCSVPPSNCSDQAISKLEHKSSENQTSSESPQEYISFQHMIYFTMVVIGILCLIVLVTCAMLAIALRRKRAAKNSNDAILAAKTESLLSQHPVAVSPNSQSQYEMNPSLGREPLLPAAESTDLGFQCLTDENNRNELMTSVLQGGSAINTPHLLYSNECLASGTNSIYAEIDELGVQNKYGNVCDANLMTINDKLNEQQLKNATDPLVEHPLLESLSRREKVCMLDDVSTVQQVEPNSYEKLDAQEVEPKNHDSAGYMRPLSLMNLSVDSNVNQLQQATQQL